MRSAICNAILHAFDELIFHEFFDVMSFSILLHKVLRGKRCQARGSAVCDRPSDMIRDLISDEMKLAI